MTVSKHTLVKTVLNNGLLLCGNGARKLKLRGCAKRVRSLKTNHFVVFNDGTSTENLQVIVPTSLLDKFKLHNGDIVSLEGEIVKSPLDKQNIEFIAEKIEKISECGVDYPLSNAHRMPVDVIRKSSPHLITRTAYFQNMMLLRNAAEFSFHDFYQTNNFVKVTTPIITSNDCEGAGECFVVDHAFDNKSSTRTKGALMRSSENDELGDVKEKSAHFFSVPTQLTVSGQLHLESLINGLHNVYTFGPAFRAENSANSIRHLSEFYMIEAEMAFVDDIHCVMDNVEQCLKHSIDSLLTKQQHLLKNLWEMVKSKSTSQTDASIDAIPNISSLRNLLNQDFVRISFAEAIGILNNELITPNNPKLTMRNELGREHELALTSKFECPVFVYNYPKDQRAFYARENDTTGRHVNGGTCAGFDLLVPRVSEVAGGGLREERLERLEAKMNNTMLGKGMLGADASGKNNNSENSNDKMSRTEHNVLDWYLDLRRFSSIPHGGYGIGFERYLQWITGSNNIRNTIPFPRYSNYCPM